VLEASTNSTILNNSKWLLNRDTIDSRIVNQKSKFTHQFNTLEEQILTILGFKDQCYLADTVVKFKPKDCSTETRNTFTPNNDGQNDVWKIHGIENYPQASLVIFNRWGVKIKSYNAHIPVATWDGTNSSGELMEAGTYYYVLDYNIAGKVQKGYITLMGLNDK
jgi:gliding motility-associated-like protein